MPKKGSSGILFFVFLFVLGGIVLGCFSLQICAAAEIQKDIVPSNILGDNTVFKTFMADQDKSDVTATADTQISTKAAEESSKTVTPTGDAEEEAAPAEEVAPPEEQAAPAGEVAPAEEEATTTEEVAPAEEQAAPAEEAAPSEEEAAPAEEVAPAEEEATTTEEVAPAEEEAAPAEEVAPAEEQAAPAEEVAKTEEDATFQIADLNKSLSSIFFGFDKSTIRQDQRIALDDAVKILNTDTKLYISLSGFTDERGTKKYNLALSVRRAEAVKNYLVAKGIDPTRIMVFGYGEDFPFKKGHRESAWRFNRRVDIQLWEALPTREQCSKK